jgi:preprotein translocase subunit SecE
VAIKDTKLVKLSKKPLSILAKIGGYFKGSWTELRQVRWPDRKATWSLTLAVLLFTGFFLALIVLLDDGFNQLFKLILK